MRDIVTSAWMTLDGVFETETMDRWFLPYHTEERGQAIRQWIMGDVYLLGRKSYEMLAPI